MEFIKKFIRITADVFLSLILVGIISNAFNGTAPWWIIFAAPLFGICIDSLLFNIMTGTKRMTKQERALEKAKFKLSEENLRNEAYKLDHERLNVNLKNIGLSKEMETRGTAQWLLDKPLWMQIIIGKLLYNKYKKSKTDEA